jgi:hypothetical protein
VWGRKHYANWAYSYCDFFAHSVKKMVQVLRRAPIDALHMRPTFPSCRWLAL